MPAEEFRAKKRAAGLSDSDWQKVTGIFRLDVIAQLQGEMRLNPIERVLIDYLARHPERVPDMLAIADARISDMQHDMNRAARRAHLQPEKE